MTEADLNRILGVGSCDFAYKISDMGRHALLPFDFFGVVKDKCIYVESKLLKEPSAFNFNRLEDHQIANLLAISKTPAALNGSAVPLFLICVNYGTAKKRVYYFKDMQYLFDRKLAKRSITKKEFDSRSNYVLIKNGKIDYSEIFNTSPSLEYLEVPK